MSDLAPLFASLPILRDRTILEQQGEIKRLEAELRRQKRVTVTLRVSGHDEWQGPPRIVAEGNLEEAVPCVRPSAYDDSYCPEYRGHSFLVVPLKPVAGPVPVGAELIVDYETTIEIRVGPMGGIVATSQGEGEIEFPDDCFMRMKCHFDGESDVVLVDDSRKTAGISYKYVPKEGVNVPDSQGFRGQDLLLQMNEENFTAEFDALYLAVATGGQVDG